jgi:hypothetical protein
MFVEKRTGRVVLSGAGDLECLRQGLQAKSPRAARGKGTCG